MFDTLSDQIKADERGNVSTKEKAIRYLMVLLITALVFLGIYFLPQLG